jgi:hypothetical protein
MKNLLLFGVLALCLNSFGQVPSYVSTNGLVGWWPFNGTANDESGNGNNGTVNGAALTADRFGLADSAYSFNGISDFIELPNIIPVQVGTISFWFLTNTSLPGLDGNANQVLLYHSNVMDNGWGVLGASNMQTHTGIHYTGSPDFMFDNSAGFKEDLPTTISSNTWYHLALTFDKADSARCYFNGELLSTRDLSTESANIAPTMTYIGKTGNGARKLNGAFDDLGIWNRELEVCEIQDLYNSQLNSVSGIGQNGVTLTAIQNGATYQWMTCDSSDYFAIVGATNQMYEATQTGNYAVEVTFNGCTTISECLFIDFTGIDEIEPLISVHPNPTKDEVTLSVGAELLGTGFIVTDNAGRIILTDTFKSIEQKVNLSGFDNGIYYIRTDKESPVKIIKQ